jgi:polyprenyldihydroxybenzoate methyltransferase/3-demethylubiquinol 3-O-methyltransferase
VSPYVSYCSEAGGSTEGGACAESGLYDAVVASEVIEHVENPALFLEATAGLLKEGGSIFLTTINRTSR